MHASPPVSAREREKRKLRERACRVYQALQQDDADADLFTAFDDLLWAKTRDSRQVLQWRESKFDLNLLQLAIVYGRSDLVVSLTSKFDAFLFDNTLYAPRWPHGVESRDRKQRAEACALVNPPVHLAACLGQRTILSLFLSHHFDLLTSIGTVTLSPIQTIRDPFGTSGPVENLVDAVPCKAGSVLDLALGGRHEGCVVAILQHVINGLAACPSRGVFQYVLKTACRELLHAPLLHQASLLGDARTAELLLANFPSEAHGRFKNSLPVHTAIRCGNAPFARVLLQRRCAGEAPLSLADFEALLRSLAQCRFLRSVREVIKALVEVGGQFLMDANSRAPFALLDAVSEISKWTLVSLRTPRFRLRRFEQLMGRKVTHCGRADVAIRGFFEEALSAIRHVNGEAELRHVGLTCMDLVIVTCQNMAAEGLSDRPLLPVLRRLLECGFHPNVWKTQADLRHLQGFLFKSRPGSGWELQEELLNLLCQFGWRLDHAIVSTPLYIESRPPPVWLATCCTVSWCSHVTGTCDVWRENFVESEAFDLLLNYMSSYGLRSLFSSLGEILIRQDMDMATAKAFSKVRDALATVRSLQHSCKLRIFELLGRRGSEVMKIDCLPWTVQNFVMSSKF